MKSGGTFDLDANLEDIAQIVDGNYVTSQLLHLPLDPNFVGVNDPTQAGGNLGLRPDTQTFNTGTNPVVGQTKVTRFNLQQPANNIQLLWHCLDTDGNYDCSYPLNSKNNLQQFGTQASFIQYLSGAIGGGLGGSAMRWAMGWIRLNGLGIWWPMSLLPHSEMFPSEIPKLTAGATVADSFPGAIINPTGGVSSISAPISFFDWVGFWDGGGDVTDGPLGPAAYLLAVITANMSMGSNRGSYGTNPNYATPNSSGRKPGQDAKNQGQKQGDVLIPPGGGTRGPC